MSVAFSNSIKYVGVDDHEIEIFEGQYIVPNGISYNSYVIVDEKIAIMDTVDARAVAEWMEKVDRVLDGKCPDYLVVSHMEPDHSAGIKMLADKYPSMQIVGNAKTFPMMQQFFGNDFEDRRVVVKEGDSISLGNHNLTFVMAPMVHWPEVMVTYESTEKVLFAADGFGKFGTLDTEEDWACEARRYYFNIVGKYGMQVQALLKKASALDIQVICPLHGPVLTENLEYYLNLYDTWSSYRPESSGVFIACGSIHGNTLKAAQELAGLLEQKGIKVAFNDLTIDDFAEGIEDAFRYDRMVVACSTYDGDLFPPVKDFLSLLKSKGYRNRMVGLMENGSWAPMAAKLMKTAFEEMKDVVVAEPIVTIKGAADDTSRLQMAELVEFLSK